MASPQVRPRIATWLGLEPEDEAIVTRLPAGQAIPAVPGQRRDGGRGGGLVAGLLGRVISADDLLVATALLLAGTAVALRRVLPVLDPARDREPVRDPSRAASVSLREVARSPLVVRLALVVALVRGARSCSTCS